MKVGAERFTFDLKFCAIRAEDVLIHGPGAEEGSGEPAYLDIDFGYSSNRWHGEVRVDLGISEQFASSDEIYVFQTEKGDQIVGSAPHASMFSVTGSFFANGEGPAIEGQLEVNCG